ncbi:MAG: sulfatase [Cyclobacteriaceae bacterium]
MKNLKKIFSLLYVISFALTSSGQDRPNVLFIISDDLTTTAISGYENSGCKTPNIDLLAADGVRYTRAYCQYPVCGPSRASLMFSYYPSSTQTYGYVSGRENVGAKRKSWAQVFKENGYYTARVSKIFHMGTKDWIEGTNGQDDEASWTERFNSPDPQWNAEGEGELVQENPYGLEPPKQGRNLMSIVKAEGDDLDYSDGKTAQKASELIRKHKNKPFFLAVGFVRPHVPFIAPKAYFEPYPFQQMILPPRITGDWDDIPAAGINYVTSVNGMMSEEQEKKAIAAYYASVSYMDAQLGKILGTLKEEGLEDNTIVIFTSDHGYLLGEHRFWMKVSLHEESSRVPLIIKVPGKKPGICHSLVELLDLYPTTAALSGIEVSKNLQGKSLINTINDPGHKVRDMAFSVSLDGKAFLVRTEKWSYIQYEEDAAGGMELYDMEFDAKQYNNLAHLPQYEDVMQQMRNKLKQKLNEVRTNDLGINYSEN